MQLDEARNLVRNTIERSAEKIISAGEHIWKNPESGYRECKTSAFLVSQLQDLGLKVRTNLALTGFRADFDTGKPGPTIAILGELDSLIQPNHPQCDKETGAVHSCGHHTCAAALLGAAIGLIRSGVGEHLSGKIAFIGCPAEEGIEMEYRKSLIDAGKIKSIAGKSQLIREGVFDDIDLAYMQHLSVYYGYHRHNGAINKRITFHGKSCHASGPQFGKNALNAMTLALNAIALLRESYSNEKFVRIHGIVTNGGDAVNIIPDKITMDYMIRAMEVDKLLKLNSRFDNAVLYAAKAAECEASIDTFNGYMPLENNPDLGNLMKETAYQMFPDIQYKDNSPDGAGSTDAGDVALIVPMVHGEIPGGGGEFHGNSFFVADPQTAYVRHSILNAALAVNLLYGKAEAAQMIADQKKNLMPIPEYIEMIDRINRTVSSENL